MEELPISKIEKEQDCINILRKLDDVDLNNSEKYIRLSDPHLGVFEELMSSYCKLMLRIRERAVEEQNMVQYVLALSASGSFRNIRVAYKLLLEGYFAEMHYALRMVEQWLECSVVIEAFPEVAQEILDYGLDGRRNKK